MASKILVVDDSKDIRFIMSMMLKSEGYEIAEAGNGIQALQKLENETLPNLIFLDNSMEEMDGPQFLDELEQRHPEILSNIPIVMLTGNKTSVSGESRVVDIISKPVSVGLLLELVKQYLNLGCCAQ